MNKMPLSSYLKQKSPVNPGLLNFYRFCKMMSNRVIARKRSDEAISLLQQQHFPGLDKGSGLQMREITPAGYSLRIKLHFMDTGRVNSSDQRHNFAALHIEDHQRNIGRLRQFEGDVGFIIEGIGMRLSKPK